MRRLESLLSSKIFIITLLVLPGLWMAWPLLNGDPTVAADPLKFILHHLGFTASVILAIVLSLSPLRVIFPKSRLVLALNRHRRLIGVTVFVYVVLHVTAHFLYEGGFATFPADIEKPFILTGLIAFAILFLLAITSLNRAVRWLGARRWKWLHRLVYVAAVLVVYHQIYARKIFPVQVLWIFLPLVALELMRMVLS
ncbi:MAG TPA: ferric reductase-like transmembrane domain-containing protein, partial [Candidatus Methylacidiphilales bacterium]